MKTCTSNVHYMFYPNNDPLPLKEFQSKARPNTICSHCAKCREYRYKMDKRGRVRDYTKKEIRPTSTPYDEACLRCIQRDCIRESGHEDAHHDNKYLNRCMLAVARKFDIKDPRNIPHSDKIIKWQSLNS